MSTEKRSKKRREPAGLGGWLLLLLLAIWLNAAARLATGVTSLVPRLGSLLPHLNVLHRFAIAGPVPPLPAIVAVVMGLLGAVSGFLLARKNRTGPEFAKVLVTIDTGYYLVAAFLAYQAHTPIVAGTLAPWIQPAGLCFASVVCLAYLLRSRRVTNTYFPQPVLDNPAEVFRNDENSDALRNRIFPWEEVRTGSESESAAETAQPPVAHDAQAQDAEEPETVEILPRQSRISCWTEASSAQRVVAATQTPRPSEPSTPPQFAQESTAQDTRKLSWEELVTANRFVPETSGQAIHEESSAPLKAPATQEPAAEEKHDDFVASSRSVPTKPTPYKNEGPEVSWDEISSTPRTAPETQMPGTRVRNGWMPNPPEPDPHPSSASAWDEFLSAARFMPEPHELAELHTPEETKTEAEPQDAGSFSWEAWSARGFGPPAAASSTEDARIYEPLPDPAVHQDAATEPDPVQPGSREFWVVNPENSPGDPGNRRAAESSRDALTTEEADYVQASRPAWQASAMHSSLQAATERSSYEPPAQENGASPVSAYAVPSEEDTSAAPELQSADAHPSLPGAGVPPMRATASQEDHAEERGAAQAETRPSQLPEHQPDERAALKAQVAAGVMQWLASTGKHGASRLDNYVDLLGEKGEAADRDRVLQHWLDQVNALCDHAWSSHGAPSADRMQGSADSLGGELQHWAAAEAAFRLTRSLDVRAALEVNGPFDKVTQDRTCLLAIAQKNSAEESLGGAPLDSAALTDLAGPEIASRLIKGAQRDMFEADLWGQVATLAGDTNFPDWFAHAGARAYQDAVQYWRDRLAAVHEDNGSRLTPVGAGLR